MRPLTISLIDAKEVGVHSATGSMVSLGEGGDGELMLTSLLGVDISSSQIAPFTAAISSASSAVNSSTTPQMSNCVSLLILRTISSLKRNVRHKREAAYRFATSSTLVRTEVETRQIRRSHQVCSHPWRTWDNTRTAGKSSRESRALPRI